MSHSCIIPIDYSCRIEEAWYNKGLLWPLQLFEEACEVCIIDFKATLVNFQVWFVLVDLNCKHGVRTEDIKSARNIKIHHVLGINDKLYQMK